jgi:hypothetical protein
MDDPTIDEMDPEVLVYNKQTGVSEDELFDAY